MLQLYPERAAEALEFHKIKQLLLGHCRSQSAKERVDTMRFMSRFETVQKALLQTQEYKLILQSPDHLPNDFTSNIKKELKLLGIQGAVLDGQQLISIRRLATTIYHITHWFKRNKDVFPTLEALREKIEYEKEIPRVISDVLDDDGLVRDDASRELLQIRSDLSRSRQEVRRTFDRALRHAAKQGYLADTSEGFLNGRRTLAVLAEYKRVVKGILHGESDSARTVFIEPEETIPLNNDIFSLERAEGREIQRILSDTTAQLQPYQALLESYYHLTGLYDFIRAKAMLAREMKAEMPRLTAHPGVDLIGARHPLLLLHNEAAGKETVPLNLKLDRQNRILIISGPNAGGKTVSMKTIGILQLMIQSGLLIPADERSEMGLFKQLFIHIGDTQSIEHELSTYSAHLRDMKYFMDFANGKTLFFIDELGSGSDPNLGGAFAEAIVEDLANKKSIGVITTHYLNLKVMAGKVPGIMNGAMAFDEEKLEPQYRLTVGKPGSSYTFAIAQRSGLPPQVIERARELTERGHFKLDKILHQTEQQSIRLTGKEKSLDDLLRHNEKLREKYEVLIDKERLRQHHQTLKLQNEIKKEELDYLRETERKLKQIIQDWKKAEDKSEVMAAAENVLFKKKSIQANQAAAKKADKNYELVGGDIRLGDLVRNKVNHQVGTVAEIRGDRGIVKIGKLPFNVLLEEWVVVRRKEEKKKKGNGG